MMDDEQFVSLVKRLADDAIRYRDQQDQDRADAVDYYNGDMERALPAVKDQSTMVSKDVRAAINKVLPSITRTLLSTPNIFTFEPVNQEDEPHAEQASEYLNEVAFPEAEGPRAVQAAIHDACLLRNGVIKAHWQKKTRVEYSRHTGLDEMSLAMLVDDDSVEVLEHQQSVEFIETEEGPFETAVHSVKIKRLVEDGKLCADPVPLEQFLIDDAAVDWDEAPLIGTVQRLKQSDLIAMGYDKDEVLALPTVDQSDDTLKQARDERVEADDTDQEAYRNPGLKEVDYYELFVRIDRDGDGLAELIRCCFGGKVQSNTLLSAEEWDEQPFVNFAIEEVPHQWQGVSVADDVMDLQKLKTSLWRETLNNVYWQNKPQPIIQEGGLLDMDAVMNPVFGKPIMVEAGRKVSDVLDYTQVQFVAQSSFEMLSFADDVIEDRTGITEASSGLAPDALQNMTAKASAMIEAAGIGRTEAIVRTVARGLRDLGRRMLRLIIQHQDKERTVRLRNEWVTYDPRIWNADMDVSVNTGLGAGSRERDLQMLMLISGQQEKLLASLGAANNPFVTPENLYNTLEKMTEAAGFPSADPFFTKPDPQQVQQMIAQAANQPDPAMEKVRAQMALEDKKLEANQAKEAAQMQADLIVKDKEIAAKSQAQAEKLQADAITNEQKLALERDKMVQDRDLRIRELEQDLVIERMKQRSDAQREEARQIGPLLDQMAAL